MSDQDTVITLTTQALERTAIPYMLTGSIALLFYAVFRLTHDLDVVVEMQQGQVDPLADELGGSFYFEREAAREAIVRRDQFNLIHQPSFFKVDCWVLPDTPFDRSAFGRRRRVDASGTSVWMTTPEDLLLKKLQWHAQSGSQVQWNDLTALVRVLELDFDRDYVSLWAGRMSLAQLLVRLYETAAQG